MTKFTFLGTRGYIEEHNKRHKYHSSLLLSSRGTKVLIDYGLIRKKELNEINPDAVLITHAHPDHYAWLKEKVETEIPVYLTETSLKKGKYKPNNYKLITPDKKFNIGKFKILPYKIKHSLRAPALGFKVFLPEKKTVVYNPDVVKIMHPKKILKGVDYYIGDGACISVCLIRRKNDKVYGHARVPTQIRWCKDYGIDKIIFTHLGKESLRREKEFSEKQPEVTFAYDGMTKRIISKG